MYMWLHGGGDMPDNHFVVSGSKNGKTFFI